MNDELKVLIGMWIAMLIVMITSLVMAAITYQPYNLMLGHTSLQGFQVYFYTLIAASGIWGFITGRIIMERRNKNV